MSGPAEPSARTGNGGPSVRLALGLCLPIIVALLGLNVLGGEGEEIDPAHFGEWLDHDLVEEIRLEGQVLRCLLRHPVRLTETKGQTPVRRVVLRPAALPSAAEVSAWREQGIRIVVDGGGGSPSDRLWLAAMVLLLGLGAAYLLLQARRHRRYGGPRQRMLDAEKQFLNGELSREEYDRLAATISAEM